MPAQSLFPSTNAPHKMTIHLHDLTHEGYPEVKVRLDVELPDGMKATLLDHRWLEGEIGDLPDQVRDLIDKFVWGEGVACLSTWAAMVDHSAQSKRVRAWANGHGRIEDIRGS